MNTELSSIIRRDAEYVEASGIEVDWSCEYETVSIGRDVFLQGHEANELIDLASKLYREAGEVSIKEAMASVCKLWVECLGE